ncbi:hypothetical protein [Methylobacterium oryzisoli]|uniref:hypothetical protein n=1 Tax=Methylobacterium oryzisoli TaxID=3385502 RepID=UPI0038916621
MPTQIVDIQARRVDFDTQSNADWLDGLLLWKAGAGGVVAGATNTGNGALTVASVDAGTALGHHVVSVTSIDNMPRITVQAPDGSVTARGVAGLPLYAGGITFTLAQGSTPFAVDDTFAIGVLRTPVDITGLRFVLQARLTRTSANVAFVADSAPGGFIAPTIAAGGTNGTIALAVPRAMMSPDRFAPSTYVHDILAIDPESGRVVPAFFGEIAHAYGVTQLS